MSGCRTVDTTLVEAAIPSTYATTISRRGSAQRISLNTTSDDSGTWKTSLSSSVFCCRSFVRPVWFSASPSLSGLGGFLPGTGLRPSENLVRSGCPFGGLSMSQSFLQTFGTRKNYHPAPSKSFLIFSSTRRGYEHGAERVCTSGRNVVD